MDAVRKVGRKKCSARLYAEELGIPFRRLKILGGEARLRAMSDDARAILLKPGPYGSKDICKGGLPARGYISGVPGIRSQAERVA